MGSSSNRTKARINCGIQYACKDRKDFHDRCWECWRLWKLNRKVKKVEETKDGRVQG